ncbi:MAG: lysophospholipid acyltransferase family protein [Devosia sp.]|nr:lysophospholipid acyltransferase family protein [Devosia sp.]
MIVLRSAAFNIFFFGGTFVMSAAASVVRMVHPPGVLGAAQAWARLIIWGLRTIGGIRVEVIGAENLPTGAALIASAHQSAFDTVVWLTLVPRCCYVFKHELTRIPLFGHLVAAAGMIPIDRSSGSAAIRTLLRGGDRAKREGRQIVIFPEGTRAPLDGALPLQPGVAALAGRTGLPVIPVATDSGRYWGRRAFHKRPGTIRIVVRPPLPVGLSRAELMRRLEQAMRMDAPSGANPGSASPGEANPGSASPDGAYNVDKSVGSVEIAANGAP